MERKQYSPGDPVVYRKLKVSPSPGPRARDIDPAPRGEDYSYIVDKFWVVVDFPAPEQVRLSTRRGKQHTVSVNDPNLRPARWWERLLYRDRFPRLDELPEASSTR